MSERAKDLKCQITQSSVILSPNANSAILKELKFAIDITIPDHKVLSAPSAYGTCWAFQVLTRPSHRILHIISLICPANVALGPDSTLDILSSAWGRYFKLATSSSLQCFRFIYIIFCRSSKSLSCLCQLEWVLTWRLRYRLTCLYCSLQCGNGRNW